MPVQDIPYVISKVVIKIDAQPVKIEAKIVQVLDPPNSTRISKGSLRCGAHGDEEDQRQGEESNDHGDEAKRSSTLQEIPA